jgi:leukotriene-A4 hydrolase
MMRKILFSLGVLWAMTTQAQDPHSYANYHKVQMTSLYLDLEADFAHKKLSGFAELSLDWKDPKTKILNLDTRDLIVERVLAKDSNDAWEKVAFVLGARHPVKGQNLQVTLPRQAASIRVYYRTVPTATGLQWLTPKQTMSGNHPFMFSQSQAIHARSWVPLQDTPAVRFSYRAKITAPSGLRVVMSADNDPAADGKQGWRFHMPMAIPSYLMAIAIGEIEFKELGPRSGVYAEPLRLQEASYEFVDTEKMIQVAESLYGPYRWGRYDMLVLPPSFPYGGMENPKLTFLTPTMIAGDRSLVSLIAHELAHSWSGNLVTNTNWRHFWLNEGFTTYVENRIVEAVYGAEVAVMQQQVDQAELLTSMREVEPEWQALVTERDGADPDESYTDAAYTKGAWFLRTLELRVGREKFDTFLRGWFDAYAFKSVTTDDFVSYLREHLLNAEPALMSEDELKAWLYGAGVPATAKQAYSSRLAQVDSLRERWLKNEISLSELQTDDWSTSEWLHFLNEISESVSEQQVSELDKAYSLATSGNNEKAFRFFVASIKAGYGAIRPALEKFLMSVGRRKFIKPLYTELAKTPSDKAWAISVYAKARERYHPVTQAAVDGVLRAAN